VRCRALQCVAVCCSALQCDTVHCNVLQHHAPSATCSVFRVEERVARYRYICAERDLCMCENSPMAVQKEPYICAESAL